MCSFNVEFNKALKSLVLKGDAFDMMDLTRATRLAMNEIAPGLDGGGGRAMPEYIKRVNGQIIPGESVKFLALTAFEDGLCPGFVLDVQVLPEGAGRKTAWVFRPIRATPSQKWYTIGKTAREVEADAARNTPVA